MRVVNLKETERTIDWIELRREIAVEMLRLVNEDLARPDEELENLPIEELGRRARLTVYRKRGQA